MAAERGTNTVGMLLAHNAVAEVQWTQVALLGMAEPDATIAIGISMDDDGMPIAPDAEPLPYVASARSGVASNCLNPAMLSVILPAL